MSYYPITMQEAYEEIRTYFSQPDATIARTVGGSCVYRAPGGAKCAFGAIIPDDLYTDEFEGCGVGQFTDFARMQEQGESKGWIAAYTKAVKIAGLVSDVSKEFLRDAQYDHDNAKTVSEFLAALDETAKKYGLRVYKTAQVPVETDPAYGTITSSPLKGW